MKRWIALMLALAMLLGLPALAEVTEEPAETVEAEAAETEAVFEPVEIPPEPTFLDGLAAWADGLDLAASDYRASYSDIDGVNASATLRQDGPLTELDVGGLFTLQLSEQTLAIRTNSRTYALDLAALTQAAALWSPETLAEDQAWLMGLVQRAFQAILMPSVDFRTLGRGATVHIDIDNSKLLERARDFLDELIHEPGTLERLLERFGPILAAANPGEPITAELLRDEWETYPPRWRVYSIFKLEADATWNYTPWSGPELTCVGSLTRNRETSQFSLIYTTEDDHAALRLNVSSMDQYYGGATGVDARLNLYENRLDGALTVNSYSTASLTLEGSWSADALDFQLNGNTDGASAWTAHLYGNYDADERHITGALETTYEWSGDEPTTLATLDARYGYGGLPATLTTSGIDLLLDITGGQTFRRVCFAATPKTRYSSGFRADFWSLQWGANTQRVRCELSSGFRNGWYTVMKVTGTTSVDGFNLDYELPRQYLSGKLRYETAWDGFDFEASSLNSARDRYYFNVVSAPTGVRLSRHGGDWKAGFSGSYGVNAATADVTVSLDELGALAAIEAELTNQDLRTTHTDRVTATYEGDALTVVTDDATVVLEKLSETDSELVYRLTSSVDPEEALLTLTIDGGRLSGTVALSGETMAEAEIAPMEKTPVEPLDLTDAASLMDEANIDALLIDLGLMDEPARPAEVYITDDDAEEAVEEAAEAVEEAAEAVEEAAEAAEIG